MQTLNQSIAQALESGRQHKSQTIVTARSCMERNVVTIGPHQTIHDAMALLLKHGVSGTPVVAEHHRLVGMLSEIDCLRSLASSSYDSAPFGQGRLVEDLMTRNLITVSPDVELFTMVQLFEEHSIRRLPVVEGTTLIGQVSRRDILRELNRL